MRCSRQGSLSPQDISSYILEHLVKGAEETLQGPVDGAVSSDRPHVNMQITLCFVRPRCPLSWWCMTQVIAVPAHFDNRQRSATLEAARKAGLSRVQLLQGVALAEVCPVYTEEAFGVYQLHFLDKGTCALFSCKTAKCPINIGRTLSQIKSWKSFAA